MLPYLFNFVDWEPSEFVRDIRVLRYTSKLRKFTLCDNPFCKKLPNYRLYVIHEIAKSQRGIHLKTSGSQLEQFDNQPVTKALRERALNQQFTSDGFLASDEGDDKSVSMRESKSGDVIDPSENSNDYDNMEETSVSIKNKKRRKKQKKNKKKKEHIYSNLISFCFFFFVQFKCVILFFVSIHFNISFYFFLLFYSFLFFFQYDNDRPIPTIASLTSTLEDCFAHPTQSISKVHLLMKHARIIMHSRSKHDQLFRESLSGADRDDEEKKANQQRLAVLEFLQHMQLLMQRQPQLMPSLLRVLANLAAVSEGLLGDRCLEALQDVMKSGTEEKELVIEVMNECVIPQLKATRTTGKSGGNKNLDSDEIKVRKQLTAGMERLADGSGMGQSLSALVDTLVSWMSEDQPDVEVISMCAVATSHPKNAIQMAFSGEMWNAVMREMRNGTLKNVSKLRICSVCNL